MTVATSKKVVVLMEISTEIEERRSLLSAYEIMQTIIAFGMFTVALVGLVVTMLKNDKEK
ncbi:putative holin-like toxin [Enterococcus mundtii]|nr:putative holin-like toxin [Enterococcus mundtii]MBO1084827.1 putative holin-like toxin [Enterococcus mundtii]MDV7745265.1 putative holin-like toxin [Enterococcus mundtii]